MKKIIAMATTVVVGAIAAIGISQTTFTLSTQQALNKLAGRNKAPYTEFTTQQAVNHILSDALAYREYGATFPGVFTIVVDDNLAEWSLDSIPNYTQIALDNGIGIGFTMEVEQLGKAGVLTRGQAQALYAAGCEMGTAGYDEISKMYNGDVSLLAQGYTAAQEDSFYNNIRRGVLAQRDTLGMGQPRFHSYSNSSGCRVTALACINNGIDYGVSSWLAPTPSGSFDADNGEGFRNNADYNNTYSRFGAWGNSYYKGVSIGTSAGGAKMSANRFWRPNRYEIAQNIAESSSFAIWRSTLVRAAQTGGLVVLNLHRASDCETATGATWDSLMTMIKEDFIDTGLMVSENPSNAFDRYYKRFPGPYTNMVPDNFADIDADTYLDNWVANRATWSAADTAKIKPWGTATSGHNGKKAYSLNWTGSEGGTAMISGQTVNDAWEGTKAMLASQVPKGGGWLARFEVWIAADSAGAGYTSISGDTVGVTFYGQIEGYTNRWGSSSPNLESWGASATGSGANFPTFSSHDVYGALGPATGQYTRLGARNNLSRPNGKEWNCFITTWEVPEYVDYIFVSIWKGTQSPANGIVISDYSLTFSKMDGGKPFYGVETED